MQHAIVNRCEDCVAKADGRRWNKTIQAPNTKHGRLKSRRILSEAGLHEGLHCVGRSPKRKVIIADVQLTKSYSSMGCAFAFKAFAFKEKSMRKIMASRLTTLNNLIDAGGTKLSKAAQSVSHICYSFIGKFLSYIEFLNSNLFQKWLKA